LLIGKARHLFANVVEGMHDGRMMGGNDCPHLVPRDRKRLDLQERHEASTVAGEKGRSERLRRIAGTVGKKSPHGRR